MIEIKKRISFEFLGEEYKDAYLVFKSVPIADYKELLKSINGAEKNKEDSLEIVLDTLKKYFIKGEFPNVEDKMEAVTKEDLGGLDSATTIKCFELFTGQDVDPKAETPSQTPLPTTATT